MYSVYLPTCTAENEATHPAEAILLRSLSIALLLAFLLTREIINTIVISCASAFVYYLGILPLFSMNSVRHIHVWVRDILTILSA